MVRPISRAACAVVAPPASSARMRASTGETRTGSAGERSRSPPTRSITSSAGVASTVSLTGSAVSSPNRSAPPGARQHTDT
ncbi:hypothetical protein M2155_007364 [Streptomyces sp. SAI-119]|nr:hypothetical protein [Streptomyces sp. SAI-119]